MRISKTHTRKNRAPEIHFYEWRVSAWFTSETRDRLDASGRNIYRECLDTCYAQGQFPDDPEWIIRRSACTPEQFEKSWPIIRKKFRVSKSDSAMLTNPQADIYRREYFRYLKQQSSNRKMATYKSKGIKRIHDDGQTVVPENGDHRSTNTIQDNTIQYNTPISPQTQVHEYVIRGMESRMFDDLAAKIYKRHRRKDKRILFEQMLAQQLAEAVDPVALAERIDKQHEAWCRVWADTRTSDTMWPNLPEWIRSGGFEDELPQPEHQQVHYPTLAEIEADKERERIAFEKAMARQHRMA